MKNGQRILALLTSLGLTATLSACGSSKNGASTPIDSTIVYETAVEHGEESKGAKRIVERINEKGTYSVKLNGTQLTIEQLSPNEEFDYESLRSILDEASIENVSVGLKDASVSLQKLFDGKSDISVSIYEIDPFTEDNATKLCDDIKNVQVKLKYVIYKGSVTSSTIKIANTIGSLNGSLSVRCGNSNIDSQTLFDSLDNTCEFSSVELFSSKKDVAPSLSNVNALSLKLYLDLGATDEIEVGSRVRELDIIDDTINTEDYDYGHEVFVNVPAESELVRSVIHVERPIYVGLDAPVEKVINVPSKEVAELYIDHGFTSCEAGALNIVEDSFTILINDGIDYIDYNTDTVTHYDSEEFTISALYSEEIGNNTNNKSL